MIELNQLKIVGETADIKDVKEKFGEIEFEFSGYLSYEFQLKHKFILRRFCNVYRGSTKPLYILIPDEKILCVWPDNKEYILIRYGTAGKSTPGFALHLIGGTGLYICLKPTEEKLEIGNLGI